MVSTKKIARAVTLCLRKQGATVSELVELLDSDSQHIGSKLQRYVHALHPEWATLCNNGTYYVRDKAEISAMRREIQAEQRRADVDSWTVIALRGKGFVP